MSPVLGKHSLNTVVGRPIFEVNCLLDKIVNHVKSKHNHRYCTKTMQVFFGHVFFSVTETDETIKIYKEYSKMDWKRMKQVKQTNSSSH